MLRSDQRAACTIYDRQELTRNLKYGLKNPIKLFVWKILFEVFLVAVPNAITLFSFSYICRNEMVFYSALSLFPALW